MICSTAVAPDTRSSKSLPSMSIASAASETVSCSRRLPEKDPTEIATPRFNFSLRCLTAMVRGCASRISY